MTSHVLPVGLAADDDVIHPGKSYLAVSDGPVQTPLRYRGKSESILLYSNSGLLHVLWADRDLMVPLLQVNPGEDCTTDLLGGKIQDVGKRIYVRPALLQS
jgi:hypothetical protein